MMSPIPRLFHRNLTWFQQNGWPVVVRWWIWVALVISLAYLTIYFSQSSLDARIRRGTTTIDSIEKKWGLKQERVTRTGRHTNTILVSGYKTGMFIGYVSRNTLTVAMLVLLVIALLELQYRYVFQKLFERDAVGRRAYAGLILISWFVLALALNDVMGTAANQFGLGWTVANWFVLLNIGYSLFTSWRKVGRQQLILTQQKTEAELNALKAQVNPHFLFNSLNNIYGTALVENSPRTAESIQQLSGIVRYVMEESRQQTTDIQRELRFIDDFVELQRIRLPHQDTIDIKVTVDWDEKPARIVPLLLNPIIENAFKYGISIQHPCFIHIWLSVQNGTLHLKTENSIVPKTTLETGTGLGLANVRRRLTLAYPNRHKLTIAETSETFRVDLLIKLL